MVEDRMGEALHQGNNPGEVYLCPVDLRLKPHGFYVTYYLAHWLADLTHWTNLGHIER
jgi:hypothetical protein